MLRQRPVLQHVAGGLAPRGDGFMSVKPCYRTPASTSRCSICGRREKNMHLPTGRVGHFCTQCCPACGKKA